MIKKMFLGIFIIFNFLLMACPSGSRLPVTISLDQTSWEMGLDATHQFTAVVNNSTSAESQFVWTSSNTAVADFTSAGLLLSKAAGTTLVTVSLSTDVTIFAQCQVTVNNAFEVVFETNGGTPIARQFVASGSLAIRPEPTTEKNGYILHSWRTDPELTDTWDFSTDTVVGNMTLYARWSLQGYSITYNLNGGSLPATGILYAYDIETTYTLPTCTKSGFVFVGWYENAEFTGTVVTTIPVGSTGGKVFYAKWATLRNITFHSNTTAATTVVKTAGEGLSFELISNSFTYNGYKFLGWANSSAAVTPNYVLPASITIGSSDLNFYAVWACEFTYTVTAGNATITGFSSQREVRHGLTIPSSLGGYPVTAISDNAFKDNKDIESLYFPNSLITLGGSAFNGCTNLAYVSAGTGLQTIGVSTFSNCTSLPNFHIPNSAINVSYYAFMGCTSLTSFAVDGAHPNLAVIDGVLYDHAKTSLINYPAAKSGTSFTVPSTVTEIVMNAFYMCKNLQTIIIPMNVNSIGNKCFYGSTSLTRVELADTTPPTLAGNQVFDSCLPALQILVPSAAVGTYEGSTYWSEYVAAITAAS